MPIKFPPQTGRIEVWRGSVRVASGLERESQALVAAVAHWEANGGSGLYEFRYPHKVVDLSTLSRTVFSPDTTPPTAPIVTATTVSASSISVALTAPSSDIQSVVASYRLEYKRTVDSTWTLDSASLVAGSFPRTINGLSASTSYDVRCRATDGSNNVGAFSATSSTTTSSSGAATGNWAQRIAGTSVVWYHRFDNVAELNRFRWAGSYGSGNDPLAVSPKAQYLTWHATGGPDNGPYIQLYRPAGGGDGSAANEADSSYWWRPLSPLTGASNGRGTDDPGASGSIPLRTFSPTDGGDQTVTWSNSNRAGFYGRPEYQAAGPYFKPSFPQSAKTFDGHDFWLQVRTKVIPSRMTTGNAINGKLFNFTKTSGSYSSQELVTVSAFPTPSSPVGGPYQANVMNMYEGLFGYIGDGAVSVVTINNITGPQWAYSGGWDTLLYHVTPGTANNPALTGTILKDTRIEIWAAHEGATEYTKIWDVMYRAVFDDNEEFSQHNKYAWNAFIFWIYQNGLVYATDVTQRCAQIIFSKATIPLPTVSSGSSTALGLAAAQMVAGEWRELTTTGFTGMTLPNSAGDGSSPFIEFTDKCVRNHLTKRIYVLGCARGHTDPAYQCGNSESPDAAYRMFDEVTNTWSVLTGAPVNTAAHAYHHMTMNQANGDYYYLQAPDGAGFGNILRKRDGVTGAWSVLPSPPSTGAPGVAIEWFPDRDRLIMFDGGNGFPASYHSMTPAGVWSTVSISGSPLMGAATMARYSAVHHLMYFGGGNGLGAPGYTGNRLYTQDASGTITRRADCPVSMTQGGDVSSRTCLDPVTGRLLVLSHGGAPGAGRIYEYNPTSDVWTDKGTHPLGAVGTGHFQGVFVEVPESGVIFAMMYNPEKVWLYRNTAGVAP